MKQKTFIRLALSAVMCLSAISGRAQQMIIGDGAFQGCTSLKGIDIPSKASLGSNVFEGCSSLEYFWAKNLSALGIKAFYNCQNLSHMGIATYYRDWNAPNRIIGGDCLFEGCINTLIEEDVTSIRDYAFAGRGIKKVNIPEAVTKIGEYAFENCKELEEVQVNWELPLDVPATTFSGVDCFKVTLYCPEDVEDFYAMTSVWEDFYVRVGEITGGRNYYAEVGKAGYVTTYFPASVVVPEGVEAYYISGVGENGTMLVMNELQTIPANTGVLLHAAEGMHTFEAAVNAADALTDNKLVAVAGGKYVPASDATYSNYVLQKQDAVAFYKVIDAKETVKPSAYLKLSANEANVRMLPLDDAMTTTIQSLTNTEQRTEIYDLAGRRLSKLQKGINIVNGVKILVK